MITSTARSIAFKCRRLGQTQRDTRTEERTWGHGQKAAAGAAAVAAIWILVFKETCTFDDHDDDDDDAELSHPKTLAHHGDGLKLISYRYLWTTE